MPANKKKRKWAFVAEGAEKREGGSWNGPRTGYFKQWYVTGGDGTKFERSPYADTGWKVQKDRTDYSNKPVLYQVRNEEDVAALNAFVGEPAYPGWGKGQKPRG